MRKEIILEIGDVVEYCLHFEILDDDGWDIIDFEEDSIGEVIDIEKDRPLYRSRWVIIRDLQWNIETKTSLRYIHSILSRKQSYISPEDDITWFGELLLKALRGG